MAALAGGLTAAAEASSGRVAPLPRAVGATQALITALRAGDTAQVAQLATAAGTVGAQLAEWLILREGGGDLPRLTEFLTQNPHWPEAERLRRQAEALLASADDATALAFFARWQPVSAGGWLRLARALDAAGAKEPATTIARRLWREMTLSREEAEALLALFGPALTDLHAERLEMLLWAGEAEAARQLLALVAPERARLAEARLELQAEGPDREAEIARHLALVPQALADDPGLAFDRFQRLLRLGKLEEAQVFLASRPISGLGRPEAWGPARQRLARQAFAAQDYERAYILAANHGLASGAVMADLEWLAGFIALKHLGEPERARRHFAALRARVNSPISLARAGYWEGRALLALGQDDQARAAFDFAAQYQTAFYGQLAAEQLGLLLDADLVAPPEPPDWRQTARAESDLAEAALLLHRMGLLEEARLFALHLAQSLEDPEELAAFAALWLEQGAAHIALVLAKSALERGILLMPAYFPLTELARFASPVPPELVLAVARRESAFNPTVISRANARGLMQVLPSTAQLVARRIGLPYDEARLTTDPAYNARLGVAYLADLLARFGAFSLVAAAYNAGPNRAMRWIEELGDPRSPEIDPIEWVERIPFAETRSYVMRVLEAAVIYRALLTGERRITLTRMLRGMG